jgi:predicted naringenin-chalcone synthase
MTFAIRGLGTAVPVNRLGVEESTRIAQTVCARTPEQRSWLPGIYENSGVRGRHFVMGRDVVRDVLEGTRDSGSMWLPGEGPDDRGPTTAQRMAFYAEHAGPLAVRAARAALETGGLPAEGLTHLITVSCTGFRAPGVDWALVRALELAPTVERTQIGFMGCHGALNGLRVAAAFAGADASVRVLLCAVELCSVHYHYGWDPQKMVANVLFADGAAAAVGCAAAAAPAGTWRVAATGCCLLPDSERAMTWTIGGNGFEMTLSRGVPRLIHAHLRPWLEGWLGRQGLAVADVASWVVHPGGPAILDAAEEALGLPRRALEESRAVLAEYGNMSSPTVLFILDRLRAAGARPPCVLLGFGPGLVAEAVLLRD